MTFIINQNIVHLDISMINLLRMHIWNSREQLLNNWLGFNLRNDLIGKRLYIFTQTFSLYIFSNQKYLFWRIKRLIQLYNIGMLNSLKHRDFSHDAFLSLRIYQFKFLINFHSDFTICWYVCTKLDSSVCSLSKSSINWIRINAVFVKEVCTKVVLLRYDLSSSFQNMISRS